MTHRYAGVMHTLTYACLSLVAATACEARVPVGTIIHRDASADGSMDATVDASTDAPLDAPMDAPVDAPVDASTDAPLDALMDAPIDAPFCSQPPADGSAPPDPNTPVSLPWSTGFEDGFCAYGLPTGFCIATGIGSYVIVAKPLPVHQGNYAAKFTVSSDFDAGAGGSQARCVVQGVFPDVAYYSAWYYVPASAPTINAKGVWNLLHFQTQPPGVWDVTLVDTPDGGLHAIEYYFGDPGRQPANNTQSDPNALPPIPIDHWFHVEVYFKRDNDAGELSMWQDGKQVQMTGIQPAIPDGGPYWGQWFVGNLVGANAVSPPVSTVYVDDVKISTSYVP